MGLDVLDVFIKVYIPKPVGNGSVSHCQQSTKY